MNLISSIAQKVTSFGGKVESTAIDDFSTTPDRLTSARQAVSQLEAQFA